jgi:hypothetical protein
MAGWPRHRCGNLAKMPGHCNVVSSAAWKKALIMALVAAALFS